MGVSGTLDYPTVRNDRKDHNFYSDAAGGSARDADSRRQHRSGRDNGVVIDNGRERRDCGGRTSYGGGWATFIASRASDMLAQGEQIGLSFTCVVYCAFRFHPVLNFVCILHLRLFGGGLFWTYKCERV